MTALVLRTPESRDIDALWAIMNRPAVQWGTGRMPRTPRSWIEARVPATDPNVHSVVADLGDGVAIGWATVVRGTDRRAHVGDLSITVHDAFHGKGIGTALMASLVDTADNWLGLRRLSLGVNPDNARAIALYRRFGFEDEGRLRGDLLRDGVLIDTLIMGRLRPAAEVAP